MGGGSGLFGGGSRSAPAPARTAPPAAPAAASPVSGGAGSGMMGMVASGMAMGAGAAVGSSMVHGAMNMMSGSGSDDKQQQSAVPQQSAYAAQPIAQNNPCQEQLNQFMQCSQQNSDLSLCAPFNDIYRDCKLSHGL